MIKKIEIYRYKCFENYTVNFQNSNIIIGENNAGKSTVTEVLRIVAIANKKLMTTNYSNADPSLNIGIRNKGVKISLKNIDISKDNMFYRYDNTQNAEIRVFFDNDVKVKIYINKDTMEIFSSPEYRGKNIITRDEYKKYCIDKIKVLPQIGILKKDEDKITEDTIINNMEGRLSSLHFRNELLYYKNEEPEMYEKYLSILEMTWQDIKIESLYLEGKTINLDIRNEDFVVEVAQMGSGIQMWLQIIWFIAKSEEATVIVLDEPDVYLHPELHKKIVEILRKTKKQFIIPTHSVEIMSMVDYDDIIIINKRDTKSQKPMDIESIQTILDKLGSVHVLQYIYLDKYKKILYVEGDDEQYLRGFYKILFPDDCIEWGNITKAKTGGWGSWKDEVSRAKQINKSGYEYTIYYVYDRDYHLDDEINFRYKEAKENNINLHIWNKKEIENYIINENVILRVLIKRGINLELEDVKKIIEIESNNLKEDLKNNIADEIRQKDKAISYTKIDKKANDILQGIKNVSDRCSGKDLLKNIRINIKDKYKIDVKELEIVNGFLKKDIDGEIKNMLEKIKNGKKFPQ
ncbi:MAG TPA: ATP-binding protein [Clostridia bacterium]|nr:ATP-binding protein [Clostridia bacterium]